MGKLKPLQRSLPSKIIKGYIHQIDPRAHTCNSAQAMMLTVGCIQALECNQNTCPTGVTTQKEHLVKGLVVSDKKDKVAKYHQETVASFIELMAAAGLSDPDAINRSHVYRRIQSNISLRYDQIYTYIKRGCLLDETTIPNDWKFDMSLSSSEVFIEHQPLEKMHL